MANFIQGAIKRPGQLHRDLHVPQGEKIPAAKLEAAAKRHGKVGERARLAEEMRGFHHGGSRHSVSSRSSGASHPAERAYLHLIPSRRGK